MTASAVLTPAPSALTPTTEHNAAPPQAPNRPRDVRVMALERFALSITVFNILGHTLLGFEQSHWTPIIVALWGYTVELGLEFASSRLSRRPVRFRPGFRALYEFLLPTQISSMAIAMLLFAGPVLWPYLFAITVAVGSKYVFRAPVNGRWRHTLNPSNLGIAIALMLFPWVGIAPPYQFTANVGQPWDWVIPAVILTAGLMLNTHLTKKGPLIAGWVGGFILQGLLRWALFGATVTALEPLTGVAFILFTNYMITDPGTTPSKPINQMWFGLGCALIYGTLMVLRVDYTLFFALVLTCAVRSVYLLVMWGVRRD